MFNWHSRSVNPHQPHLVSPCFPACFLSEISSRVSAPFPSSYVYISSVRFMSPSSLLCSGVRPAYTNNRVPVLQRCGGQREPLSHPHEAQDGARGPGQGGLKDGVRKGMKECEEGHCMPPTLTPSKGFPDERTSPGFGVTRKRPLGLKAEDEDTEMEGERVIHLEKRAKLCTGENFTNKRASRMPQIASPFCSSSALHASLEFRPVSFPSPCDAEHRFIPCSFFKKSHFYNHYFHPNQFHLTSVPSQHALPPLSCSLSCVSLCVAASSEKCLILPLSGVREKRRRGTAIPSVSLSLSLLSALPFLRCAYPPSSKLLFSSPFFFPSSVWVSFLFLFSLACGIVLVLLGTGRRVKYPSPVNFMGENPPSAFPAFIALFLHPTLDFSPLSLRNLSALHPAPCLSCLGVCHM